MNHHAICRVCGERVPNEELLAHLDIQHGVVEDISDTMHVTPEGDIREHVTEGDLCPCLPRIRLEEGARLVVHNSYDGREIGEVCRAALGALGGALADYGHTWTPEERDAYEHAIHVLDMHYAAPEARP